MEQLICVVCHDFLRQNVVFQNRQGNSYFWLSGETTEENQVLLLTTTANSLEENATGNVKSVRTPINVEYERVTKLKEPILTHYNFPLYTRAIRQ